MLKGAIWCGMGMTSLNERVSKKFDSLVNKIPEIGIEFHRQTILKHAKENISFLNQSIRELKRPQGLKGESALIVSAGPSLHRRNSIQRIVNSGYSGTLICVDGSYIASLKAKLIPDFVFCLDPHLTRPVRWFGDPDFEWHSRDDDYFARQDLDVNFRKNSIAQNEQNIHLVNRYASKSKAIVASAVAQKTVKRIQNAGFDIYGYNPLVDKPNVSGSLTRQMYEINHLPSLNTGGTVGTVAWVFAACFLKIPKIGLLGMDFGYYEDTALEQTQTYYELIKEVNSNEIEEFFPKFTFPLTGKDFYTDPTYFWYRQNFLELLRASSHVGTFNCSEGGILFDEKLPCVTLDNFLSNYSH